MEKADAPKPQRSIPCQAPQAKLLNFRQAHHPQPARIPDLAPLKTFREASGVCREIRAGQIRPQWVGLWNPTMRPAWFHRMRSAGYRLALVYQRIEFYRDLR